MFMLGVLKHPRDFVKEAVFRLILAFRRELKEGDMHLGVIRMKELIEDLGMDKITRNSINEEVKKINKTFENL